MQFFSQKWYLIVHTQFYREPVPIDCTCMVYVIRENLAIQSYILLSYIHINFRQVRLHYKEQ